VKVFKVDLKKGVAKVMPESLDDLWHLYNIIGRRDEVYARTSRQVKTDDEYARSGKARRVPVNLGVQVEKVYWDRVLSRLRVNGIVVDAPEKLNITGSRHTIDVAVNRPLTIVKKGWLRHELERLRRASRVTAKPVVVVAIDDEEYCVAVLREYGLDAGKGERVKLPGKREAENRGRAKMEFFGRALEALREAWATLNCPVVVLGPGFIKDDFVEFLNREARDVASAIVAVKGVNSAGLSGIQESLRSGILSSVLQNLRVGEEAEAVEELLARLGKGKETVAYGVEDVERAARFGAVERLLVADSALRDAEDEQRRALEEIMRVVEDNRGEVMVVSTEHEAGAKLVSMGGVAALLRFPIQ